MRAEALSRKPGHAGGSAFSRTSDPSAGDISDTKLIRTFGVATASAELLLATSRRFTTL